jgi:hypothetical protein
VNLGILDPGLSRCHEFADKPPIRIILPSRTSRQQPTFDRHILAVRQVVEVDLQWMFSLG